uniref:Plasmid maintenance system killer protein n=1 Tax=Candidatus Kentrum sp. SD TaxID=2126332 RepID=A0A451BLK6_9GAMM|nr:MAG: Plasmid maintenance system killer protein [Candidatus Kentron sp. SD]
MVRVDYDKGFFKSVRKRLPPGLHAKLKNTLADLMGDPSHPGLNLEAIVSRDGYYSIRVNRQWRVLLRREGENHFTAIEVGSHAIYR